MQNHPHDSICGCSVDEVNREIEARFAKSLQVAEELYKNGLHLIADQIDTKFVTSDDGKKQITFAVFNFSGWKKTQVITVELDAKRIYENLTQSWNELEGESFPEFALYDVSGNKVNAKIERKTTAFGYDLPDDRFRQPYMAQRVQVTFEAEDVPAIGYQVYVLKEAEESLSTDTHELIETSTETTEATSKDKEFVMENENVFVRINLDGSFDLTDKKTGHTFENCGIYEDTGDMGNEYIYIQDTDRQTITTRNIPATIFVEENSAIRSVVKVRHELEVPEAIGDEILPQRYSCVDLYQRKAKRSEKLVKLSIETTLTLEHHAKGVKVQTTVVNTAKDHRLRVLFPAGLDSDMHFADSTFEVVRRPNRHGKAWTNPSACEHEQCFVAMEDKNAGILVANRGLYEYEILPDEENTIALTLLRSVAEMGDWGYFPTPQAQMQGSYTVEYAIFPYEPEMCAEAFALGYDYQHDLACVQLGMNREKEIIFTPQAQSGILPIKKSFFEWEGNGLNLTAFKKGANSEDIFVRFVNTLERNATLTIKKADWMKGIYQSSVIEEKKETIDEENGAFSVIERTAKEKNAPVYGLKSQELTILKKCENTIDFSINSRYYKISNLKVKSYASYQVQNAILY